MSKVTFQMPVTLTAEMLRAVRQHPTTSTEDKDEENRRIGWLLCAWDVLVEHRVFPEPEAHQHLYERLHSLSKSFEGRGRLDEHDNPDAYATILDAMDMALSQSQA